MKVFKINCPWVLPIDSATLYVEKYRLNNGNTIKRSRLSYGVKYLYSIDQEVISKQVFETLISELDCFYEPLKKLTSVFFINNKQMRIDTFLSPRFGLRLLRTNDIDLIPNWIELKEEVTNDFLYQDKIHMKSNANKQVNNIVMESIFPESNML